jgi:RNAse (barnase) inhibitor barstar
VTEVYVLDGERIGSLEDFWTVVGRAMGCGGYFGTNLDAFADCLSDGFGTPEDGDFTVIWRAHKHSQAALGYPETVRRLQLRLERCHPTNRERVQAVTSTPPALDKDRPSSTGWSRSSKNEHQASSLWNNPPAQLAGPSLETTR